MKITRRVMAGAMLPLVMLTACSAGSLGSTDSSSTGASGDGGKATSLSFLVDSGTDTVAQAEALAKGFTAANPNITIKVETRPGGTEGDNVVKTKLATGDMANVFMYNSGSLLQQISPAQNLVDVSDAAWSSDLEETFKNSASSDGKLYGSPWGGNNGGGIFYNKKIYADLGLKVPKTWAEFMANNDKIKASGKTAVIGSFADDWTSQLIVLADFHNIASQDPEWAAKFTKNEAHFSEAPGLGSFQKLEQIAKGGYMNKDFNATKYDDALTMLATGKGAHYPMLSFAIPPLAINHAANLKDIGFFAVPGDDAAKNGLTVWNAAGIYIPKSTEGDKLEAAKKFQAFAASPAGCDAELKALKVPSGPWAVKSCKMPASVPDVVKDLSTYMDASQATPALEYLSPVKGPSLAQITVEVGSGIRPAASGAKLYDEDVKKQAEQLGLPGW